MFFLYQQELHGVKVDRVGDKQPLKIYRGDRVIQRKNNYKLGIFNGTLGVVDEPDDNGVMQVDFEGAGIVELSRDNGDYAAIDLAYALTIHQVQGSEFDTAIVICHKSHSFQHHRNLLYTAVTRAKKLAVIIGDTWGIRNCATKVETGKRRTWL